MNFQSFSRKTIENLSRKGVTIIGSQMIPDMNHPMPWSNTTRGYKVNDNGTGRVWSFQEVLARASS